MDETQIAWAAGFLEGEGSFITAGRRVRVSAANCDHDVLLRLQSIFGGRVWQVTKRQAHWKDAWVWALQDRDGAIACIEAVLPYLGHRRTEQATLALTEAKAAREAKIERQRDSAEKRARIHALRGDGMLHREIAETLGVDRTYVTHVLNGKR